MDKKLYYQMNTKNISFKNLYLELKRKGIKNNKFFLALLDQDLAEVDPFDENLDYITKKKIIDECMANSWYFLRECIKFKDGTKFNLNERNLLFFFISELNNQDLFYKQSDSEKEKNDMYIRLLWEYLFGSLNANFAILDKCIDLSRNILKNVMEMSSDVPSYITQRLSKRVFNLDKICDDTTHNLIRALPMVSTKIMANQLGRGLTYPRIFINNCFSILYLNDILMEAQPAQNLIKSNNFFGCIGIVFSDKDLDIKTISSLYPSNKYIDISIFDETLDALTNDKNFLIIK